MSSRGILREKGYSERTVLIYGYIALAVVIAACLVGGYYYVQFIIENIS